MGFYYNAVSVRFDPVRRFDSDHFGSARFGSVGYTRESGSFHFNVFKVPFQVHFMVPFESSLYSSMADSF